MRRRGPSIGRRGRSSSLDPGMFRIRGWGGRRLRTPEPYRLSRPLPRGWVGSRRGGASLHAVPPERLSARRSRCPRGAGRRGAAGGAPGGGRRADRGLRACGAHARGADGGVSGDPHLYRRAEAGAVAAGSGRRDRLPHDGDVRGLRLCPQGAARGLLGQRDDLLEARPGGPRADRPGRTDHGHRGGAVGVPACDPEPGAGA